MLVADSFVRVALTLFLFAGSRGAAAAELSDEQFPDQLSLLQVRAELRRPTVADAGLAVSSPRVSTNVVIDSSLDTMLHSVVSAALAAAHDAREKGADESAAALGAAEAVVKEEALGLAGSEAKTPGPEVSPVLLESSSTAVAAGDDHTNNSKSKSEEPMAATGTCGPDFPSNIKDCEHVDFGSCGNACCNLLLTVSHSPAEAVRLLNKSLSGGGPDGRYRMETTAEGPEGFANLTEFAPDLPEPYGSSRSGLYVGQADHETVGKFNDTVNFNFISTKDGNTLLHAFSLSLVAGALGDNGQNFKNIMNPMRAAFGADGFKLEARLFNSCPGPDEKVLGPRSVSKEDVDFAAHLGALGLHEGATKAFSAAAAENDAKVATMLETTVTTASMPKIAVSKSEAVSADKVTQSGNRQATISTQATMSADEVVASENREALLAETLLAEAAKSETVSDATPTGDISKSRRAPLEIALATDALAADAPATAAPKALAATSTETQTELVQTEDTLATMAMAEAPAVLEAEELTTGEAESQAEPTSAPAVMLSEGEMLLQAFKAESPLEDEEEVDSFDGVLSDQEDDSEAGAEEDGNTLLALLDVGAELKPRHNLTHVVAVHEADGDHTPAVWLPSWVAATADSVKKAATEGVAEAANRVKAVVSKTLDDESELNKEKTEAQQRKAKSDRRDGEWSEAKAAAEAVPKTNTSDEPEVVLSKKTKKDGDTVLAKKEKHDSILAKETNKQGNSVLVGKGKNGGDEVHEDSVSLLLNGEHTQQPPQTIEADSVKPPPLALASMGRSGLYAFGTGDALNEHTLDSDQEKREAAPPAMPTTHGRSGLYAFGEENVAYDVAHEEEQLETAENSADIHKVTKPKLSATQLVTDVVSDALKSPAKNLVAENAVSTSWSVSPLMAGLPAR